MSDSEFDDDGFDAGAFAELDDLESAILEGRALPPKSLVNKPGLVQRDLFGGTAPAQQAKAGPSRANTAGSAGGGGGPGETRAKVRLSKTWDPASFAKHGWSKKNAAAAKAKARGTGKGKGKQRASRLSDEEEDNWDEDDVLDDDSDDDENPFLVDTTYDPKAPIPPIKWQPDEEAMKTFIYPVQPDKPKRTYQYNIVTRALYDNTLVSLPTGLGKTFIAAVVMLNFYRWYPRGKVLFLAPTRPLVSQQIKACHYIAGIPQADCVELTGSTMPKLRAVGWATKRVIYSTPQTVERDLAKGRLDPRDVTCIVVDEAHRASGDYSYCGVVRYMMSRNPHFRILALTATPGSRGDAVQEVIDNLHIGRIEVRADDSMDIRQYVHKKSFDLTVLPLGPQLGKLRDKWGELMMQYINPLYAAKLLWSKDPVMLAPFAVQQAFGKIKALPGGGKSNGKYFPMVKTLAMMARAMEYLVIQSVTSFESNLKDIEQQGSKNLVGSAGFREIMRETAALRGRAGYVGHPKMEKLRSMCLEHFQNAQNEVDELTGEKRETRVMIFCNFRAVVEEICACLNTQRPLIKATPFVGQASSKGVKGKSQKEQLETIKKFKKGDYNVLVATSIGEEGLDIGEIDLIVCYEANKSPIRMLQRVGRTGRARDGHIIVLMSEGREERNWDKANDAYQEVQNALTSNKIFDLYVDGERLLPDDVKPEREEVQIKALPLDLDRMTMNGQSKLERKALAEKKPKRKVDVNANAPEDAFMGFRTAGALAAAAKVKPPPPSQVLRNRKADALLSVDEEAQLRTRWQQDPSGRPVRPQRFDVEDLPFDRRNAGSALRITHHSERHRDLLSALKTCEQLADDKPQALDAWHEKHSSAFDGKLVQMWRAEERRGPPVQHTRLKRPPPSSPEQEDVPPSFPMTGFAPTFAPSAFPAATSKPKSGDDDPLGLFLPSSPVRASPSRPHSPSPTYPAAVAPFSPELSAPQPVPPASPRPSKSTKASQVLDLSLLDSDDDIEMAPPPPPLPAAPKPAPPPSREALPAPVPQHPAAPPKPTDPDTSFDAGEDFDLELSDSELLAGANIRGQSTSISPPKSKVEPPPLAASKQMKEILVLDSDEEGSPVKPKSRAPPPPLPAAAPSLPRKSSVVPPPRPSSNPKSGATAFRPFVPPRPSASAPNSAPPSSPKAPPAKAVPPAAPSRAASPPSTDEYSFFDLPDEDLDACLANIPQQAVRGAVKLLEQKQQSADKVVEDDDDVHIMPPPPVASTSKITAKPLRYNGRVPDSSDQPSPAPLAAVKGGFRPASAIVVDDSPAAATKKQVPMRRLAIADSSSPVVGGNAFARRAAAVLDESDVSLDPTQAPKQLNRLRRGRQQSVDEPEENGVLESSPPPAKKVKTKERKKKKKKPILTHKQASRFGIFDNEAVNDSASGSEASSEEYASEDSEDRAFVADETFEEDSPERMARFYRESLATQAPPQFATPGFGRNGARRWQGGGGHAARKPVPITPASQATEPDDWDYGSFVVASDEEVEVESSSQV
ncbi:hypothetical protein JCM10213_000681 [Rhodosporidiobolus nylandii]